MAQAHLERLTALDAAFLHLERASTHMHVGAVVLFGGPPPRRDELLAVLRSRLHLLPRYRQRLTFPPGFTRRPLWADDPAFDLERHVRRAELPPPGAETALLDLTARIWSEPLDRSRPLWELWLVDGLAGGRFALVLKTHHAMIDGMAGVDLARLLFDAVRAPADDASAGAGDAWSPAPEPTRGALLATGARGALRAAAQAAAVAARALARPRTSLRATRAAASGLGAVIRLVAHRAPRTPLNVPIGTHRRYAVVRADLADVRLVKDAFGGTVNDVLLAVVAGALRTWLRERGVRTEGLDLHALVPVSIRAEHERGAMGNRLTVMRGSLPVEIEDPIPRLRAVRGAMEGVKASGQAGGVKALTGLGGLAPPAILALAARLAVSPRLFNAIVTNIPGPQAPLYLLERELLDVFPVAFLPRDHALAVAIASYNGRIGFGLLGDRDALPDIDVLARGIESALAELVEEARSYAPGSPAPDGGGATGAPSGAAR
ncbi:MAG: diacylglycerol O-acyltransferase / wax synthase [Solirubrobacteraceae bacterium]|nr:diacylglycerol O-acyltransferase / wax synthase [Solirubrobacteraceae bacterium]